MDTESIGLEITERVPNPPRRMPLDPPTMIYRPPSTIEPYGGSEIHHLREERYVSRKPRNPSPFLRGNSSSNEDVQPFVLFSFI